MKRIEMRLTPLGRALWRAAWVDDATSRELFARVVAERCLAGRETRPMKARNVVVRTPERGMLGTPHYMSPEQIELGAQ